MPKKIWEDDDDMSIFDTEENDVGEGGLSDLDSLLPEEIDTERAIASLDDILIPKVDRETKNYPKLMGVNNDYTGGTPPIVPKPLPVQIEERRETPQVVRNIPNNKTIPQGGGKRAALGELDPEPKLEFSKFDYPEYTASKIEDPRSSANLERLYAQLGMAGNDIIQGLTRFKPSNDVYDSMLDSAKQDTQLYARNKLGEQKRLSDYLKNKKVAENQQRSGDINLYKAKLSAWAARQKAKSQLNETDKTTNYGLKKLNETIAEDYKTYLDSGNGVRARNSLKNLEKIATDLQYDPQFIDELKRGKTLIMERNIPYAGADWAKLGFPKIASAENKIMRMFMRDLRPILGAQFTAEEAKRVISSSFDALLSPADSLETIRQLIDEKRSEVENKEDMYRYYEGNGFNMSGYTAPNRKKEKFEIVR
ncbi:MAG: hypothetical protein EBR82_57640 [Caulobacteraceae bacterium]|nr:hypothetical protein [Caulobacteraceae bacterium]